MFTHFQDAWQVVYSRVSIVFMLFFTISDALCLTITHTLCVISNKNDIRTDTDI